MSKYTVLWEYLRQNGKEKIVLSFDTIKSIVGFDIDHSFLNYKCEASEYGYEVIKISIKKSQVVFRKIATTVTNINDAEMVATMTMLDIL